jgi:AcrR family transcriptional regulator
MDALEHPEPREKSGDDGASTFTATELTGTKLAIAEAALDALKTKGFAGASAREIAGTGSFNQALIFYHFGSVQNALLAALDLVSARRMAAYRPALEHARSASELATLARRIYAEDLENGYVTVLAEMVAGGMSDAELGAEVAARLQPWIEMIEGKLRALLDGSPFAAMLPARDVAFAIVALYLGADMLSHLDRDHTRAESLLGLGERYAPLLEALLPARGPGDAR